VPKASSSILLWISPHPLIEGFSSIFAGLEPDCYRALTHLHLCTVHGSDEVMKSTGKLELPRLRTFVLDKHDFVEEVNNPAGPLTRILERLSIPLLSELRVGSRPVHLAFQCTPRVLKKLFEHLQRYTRLEKLSLALRGFRIPTPDLTAKQLKLSILRFTLQISYFGDCSGSYLGWIYGVISNLSSLTLSLPRLSVYPLGDP